MKALICVLENVFLGSTRMNYTLQCEPYREVHSTATFS